MCIQTEYFTLAGYFCRKKKIVFEQILYDIKEYLYILVPRDFQNGTCNRPTNKNATLPHQIPHCVCKTQREIYSGHKSYFKSFQINLIYALVQLF